MAPPSDGLPPPSEPSPSRGTAALLLGLILLLAFSLRWVDLGLPSLRHDEIASARMASQATAARVIDAVARDVHPPAHFLLLHAAGRLGFDDEFGLRLPSLLFGVAGVWLTYLVGARLFGRRTGILAAALLAVSGQAVFYSQEARSYAMLMCAALAATWFWLDLMVLPTQRHRRGVPSHAGLVLCSLLCAYTHYFGLLVVTLQAAALVLRHLFRPRRLIGVGLVYGLVGAGLVPWLGTMLAQHARPSFYIPAPDPNLVRTWFLWNFNFSPWLAGLALAIGLAACTAAIRDVQGPPGSSRISPFDPAILVAAWFVGPFAAAFVQSLVSLPVLTNRNTIVSLPAAFLLLAAAVERLPGGPRLRTAAGSGVVLLFTSHLFLGIGHGLEIQRTQYREAVAHVVDLQARDAQPFVVTCGGTPIYDYYFRRLGWETWDTARACKAGDLEAVVSAVHAAEAGRFWMIHGNEQPAPDLMSGLAQRFRIVEQAVFYGADAWLFEVGPEAPARDLAGRWRTLGRPPPGTRIRQEGDVLHVHAARGRGPHRFLVCQSGPVPVHGPLHTRGRWRLDAREGASDGVQILARVYGDRTDPAMRALRAKPPRTRWSPVRGSLAPQEGDRTAELCVRIDLESGDLRLEGVGWRAGGRGRARKADPPDGD